MKALIIGDVHRTGVRSLARLDDYVATQAAKLAEAFQIVYREECRWVIQTGDLFDSPDPAMRTVSDLENILKGHDVLAIPGGHDEHAHSLESLGRTAFGHLVATERIRDISTDPLETGTVVIEGAGFSTETDRGLGDYLAKHGDPTGNKIIIHVAHGMLMERAPGFDMPHTLLSEVARHPRCPHVVICGHNHAGFGVRRLPRAAGSEVVFINPGALVRKTAAVAEMERTVQVCVLEVYPGTAPLCTNCEQPLDPAQTLQLPDGQTLAHCPKCGRGNVVQDSEYGPPELWNLGSPVVETRLIPLESARPAHEVLSRAHLEAEAQHEKDMRDFLDGLKLGDESRFLDIQAIIEFFVKSESLPADVREEAFSRVAVQREKSGRRNAA